MCALKYNTDFQIISVWHCHCTRFYQDVVNLDWNVSTTTHSHVITYRLLSLKQIVVVSIGFFFVKLRLLMENHCVHSISVKQRRAPYRVCRSFFHRPRQSSAENFIYSLYTGKFVWLHLHYDCVNCGKSGSLLKNEYVL